MPKQRMPPDTPNAFCYEHIIQIVPAIKQRISELGLTQVEVSAMTGISQSHLSLILNGKRVPSLNVLLSLVWHLEVTIPIHGQDNEKTYC